MSKSNRAYLLIIFACVLWGASPTISYIALNEIPNFYFVSLRFFIGSLMLFVIFGKNIKKMNLQNYKACIFTALFLCSGFVLETYGYRYIIPMKAAFLVSFDTILIPIFYAFLLKKKITNKEGISIGLAFFGLLLINHNGLSLEFNFGNLILILAAMCYAGQIITVSKAVNRADPGAVTTIILTFTALFSLVPAVFFEDIPRRISPYGLTMAVVSGIFCAGLPYFLQAKGQKYINPVRAGVLFSTIPIFSMIISGMALKNSMSLIAIVGSIIIIFAVVNINLDFTGKRGAVKSLNDEETEKLNCEYSDTQYNLETESLELIDASNIKGEGEEVLLK